MPKPLFLSLSHAAEQMVLCQWVAGVFHLSWGQLHVESGESTSGSSQWVHWTRREQNSGHQLAYRPHLLPLSPLPNSHELAWFPRCEKRARKWRGAGFPAWASAPCSFPNRCWLLISPGNLAVKSYDPEIEATSWRGEIFSLEAKFVSQPVDPGIPLPGIYYKEIFQNIILTLDPKRLPGSRFILAKSWNCSK